LDSLPTIAQWKVCETPLKKASENHGEMLIDGKAPAAGQIFSSPTLARTFRTLGEQGRDGFYKGRVAEAIVECASSVLI
jgi:gamma-glutamyltranspeptidase/glutathione hydrolase